MGGIVTGPIYDRGYIQELLIAGTIITVFGVMMLSLATEYYQILLAQGICVGIGSAILYVPSISLIVSRFDRFRPLAVFIATSGTAIGMNLPLFLPFWDFHSSLFFTTSNHKTHSWFFF